MKEINISDQCNGIVCKKVFEVAKKYFDEQNMYFHVLYIPFVKKDNLDEWVTIDKEAYLVPKISILNKLKAWFNIKKNYLPIIIPYTLSSLENNNITCFAYGNKYKQRFIPYSHQLISSIPEENVIKIII
jgi:hypothetical protein